MNQVAQVVFRGNVGGFPSNHTSIVSCTFAACLICKGPDDSGTIASFGLLVIVIIDALGLRNHVGGLAKSINKIQANSNHRETMGHSRLEVLGGLVFGFIFAWLYVGAVRYIF